MVEPNSVPSSPGATPEQHLTIWYDDGNVIIRAQRTAKTECGIMFKVHKSHLAQHSSVFADMFVVAGPTPDIDGQELYEGVPVVEVYDPAEDWEDLLNLLYGKISTLPGIIHSLDLMMLTLGIFRLTKKYALDDLQERLFAQVLEHWPLSLYKWDLYIHGNKKATTIEPCAAISLANSNDSLRPLLPVAYYILLHTDVDRDWDTCLTSTTKPDRSRCDTLAARWDLLSVADYQCVLRGKHNIDAAILEDFNGANFCVKCKADGCLGKMKQAFISKVFFTVGQQDTMELLESPSYPDWYKFHFRSDCCNEEGYIYMNRLRDRIWNKLPEIFGIEGLSSWSSN